MSAGGEMTEERLAEIRRLSGRVLHEVLAHLDAVTKERDELKERLAETATEPAQTDIDTLLSMLRGQKATARVVFDFDPTMSPVGVASYRGYYDQLAIEYASGKTVTVADLRRMLDGALATTFEGYKGGDFNMRGSTPVWVSLWGECSNRFIYGVSSPDADIATLLTHVEEW